MDLRWPPQTVTELAVLQLLVLVVLIAICKVGGLLLWLFGQ